MTSRSSAAARPDRRAHPAPPVRAVPGPGWNRARQRPCARRRPGEHGRRSVAPHRLLARTPGTDRGLRRSGRLGHRPHPTMPEQPRPLPQHQPPLPLVQMRQHRIEPQSQLIKNILGNPHTRTTSQSYKNNKLFPYGFSKRGSAASSRRVSPPRLPPAGWHGRRR